MKTFPTLYWKDKSGKTRFWKVYSKGDTIYTEYGVLGGKTLLSEKKCEGTNVGKRNERTPEQQAEFEAKALWQSKVDKGYNPSSPKESEIPRPMLAVEKPLDQISFPCYVQPKLDGVRCLGITSTGELLSRGGKPFTIPHISASINSIASHLILDGELYIHGTSFQTIVSLVKRVQPDQAKLEYHVYDLVSEGTFEERLETLKSLSLPPPLCLVETYSVSTKEELEEKYGEFQSRGYEGAIVRAPLGNYQQGFRSQDLVKMKSFVDAEFKIVGCYAGRGKMEGCIIFTVENDTTPATFNVNLKTSLEERKRMWKEKDTYIGQMLKVKYFERSKDGIPRFPIGLGIRDPRDV